MKLDFAYVCCQGHQPSLPLLSVIAPNWPAPEGGLGFWQAGIALVVVCLQAMLAMFMGMPIFRKSVKRQLPAAWTSVLV